MVKFINTLFGEYGYVLNRNTNSSQLLPNIDPSKMLTSPRSGPLRTSAYDAKYLRTTNLAVGSEVIKANDPNSYMKHGLLHKGQEPFIPLEAQFSWKKQNAHSSSADVTNSRNRSNESKHVNFKVHSQLSKSVLQNCLKYSKAPPKKHAGKSTFGQQHIGFANSYAASRSDLGSLASVLGSGEDLIGAIEEDDCQDSHTKKDKKNKRSQLVYVDPNKIPFSKLDKLKSQRLSDVYTKMSEKQDRTRRNLLMDKVRSTEKLKEELHRNEVEEQKNIRRASRESQRLQLRELRSRYEKDYRTRLNVLYCRTPWSEDGDTPSLSKMALPERHLLKISLPREVYGLPENDSDEKRPVTVATKPSFRFPPGKLSLSSYHKAKNNIPPKFNNVWNLTCVTPRKSIASKA